MLEHNDGLLWAIEVKRSLSARIERGFHSACEDIKPERAFLVHAGEDRYPLSANLEAVSLRYLMEELRRMAA